MICEIWKKRKLSLFIHMILELCQERERENWDIKFYLFIINFAFIERNFLGDIKSNVKEKLININYKNW